MTKEKNYLRIKKPKGCILLLVVRNYVCNMIHLYTISDKQAISSIHQNFLMGQTTVNVDCSRLKYRECQHVYVQTSKLGFMTGLQYYYLLYNKS